LSAQAPSRYAAWLGLARVAAARGIEAGGRFLCFALAAVLMPAGPLALFFLGLAWLALVSAVARLGLDRAATRHLAAAIAEREPATARRVVQVALLAAAAGGVLAGALTALAAPFVAAWFPGQEGLAPFLLIVALVLPPYGVAIAAAGVLTGQGRAASAQLVQSTLWPFAVILALLAGLRSAEALLLVIGFTQAVAAAAVLGMLRLERAPAAAPRPVGRAMLASGLPLMGLDLVNLGLLNLPLLVLGAVAGPTEVAAFGLALRLFLLPWTLLISLSGLLSARFAAAQAKGERAMLARTNREGLRLARLTALPAALLIAAFPGFWLGLFGEPFRVAAPALAVLALAQAVNASWALQDTLLAMTGHGAALRGVLASQAGALVVGAVLAVPGFGLMGAALATALPLVLGVAGCLLASRRRLPEAWAR
jgi:O-antigen/teichoic acid export membrane protein